MLNRCAVCEVWKPNGRKRGKPRVEINVNKAQNGGGKGLPNWAKGGVAADALTLATPPHGFF